MLRRVVEDFDLEEDVVLSLRTSTIDACRGREVIIPESAYIHLWKYLDEVDVVVVVGERGQGPQNLFFFLNTICIFLDVKRTKSVGRRQQKQNRAATQQKSRAISPIAPEYPSSLLKDNIETEDFPIASSTVIHDKAPLDEELSRTTPIPYGAGAERGVAGSSSSSKVPDVAEEKISRHSYKSKNADDDHHDTDDQLEVLQEEEKASSLKIADPEPVTEPEDGGENKSNSQKKFKPTVALLPKSNNNKGTCVAIIIIFVDC